MGGPQVIGGMPLRELWDDSFICFMASMRGESLLFHVCCHDGLPASELKAPGPIDHSLKTLNL